MKTTLPSPAHVTPGARGRLLSAGDIALEFFGGSRTPAWVLRNVAKPRRIRLGHSTVRWWERDVLEWLDERRGAA